jgi:hypothetical protein
MISYSINRQVKNKPSKNQMQTFNSKFQRVNETMEKLLEDIKSGYAFCIADLAEDSKTGFCHRDKSNFSSCQIVAVDIDNSVIEFIEGDGDIFPTESDEEQGIGGKLGEVKTLKRRLGSAGGDEELLYWSYDNILNHSIVRDHASFVYTTSSHTDEWHRFRIVFVLEEKIYDTKKVSEIAKYLSNIFGPASDTQASSAVQGFYGSKDCKSVFFGNFLNKTIIDNIKIEEEYKREEYKTKFNRNSDVKIHESDIITMLNFIPQQGAYIDWVKVISAIASEFDKDTTVKLVDGWSKGQIGEVGIKYDNRLKDITIGTLIYMAKQGGYVPPTAWYKEKSAKKLAPSRGELRQFLQGFAGWRRNVMKNKIIEFKPFLSTEWIQVETEHINSMLESIEELTNFKVNKTLLEEVIDTTNLSENYHPLKEYFGELKWDKRDRFADLSKCLIPTSSHFDESDKESTEHHIDEFYDYVKNLFGLWFRAAYACGVYGHPNELMIILQGNQGIGKTRFVRQLYPPFLDWSYYYTGSIIDNKDTISRLTKKFFYVDDEMEGMKKTDINFFKSLLSQNKVTVREVYGKRDTTNDRTVSFLGSVNKDEFLKDEENRRFPVIAISAVDFNLLHQIDVQQLWAQAKEEYDSGMFKNYADTNMRNSINKFNDRHYMQSDITYYIQRYIGKPRKDDKKNSIQTLNPTEIKIHIQQAHKTATDIMIPDNQLNRAWITQELKRLGYEGVNHSGNKKFKVKIAPIESYDKEDSDPILERIYRARDMN